MYYTKKSSFVVLVNYCLPCATKSFSLSCYTLHNNFDWNFLRIFSASLMLSICILFTVHPPRSGVVHMNQVSRLQEFTSAISLAGAVSLVIRPNNYAIATGHNSHRLMTNISLLSMKAFWKYLPEGTSRWPVDEMYRNFDQWTGSFECS